jgi:hypothetical protein
MILLGIIVYKELPICCDFSGVIMEDRAGLGNLNRAISGVSA